ncbi:MAG: hypothetical protein LBG60_09885 [Bifidobacteriaceae bacterium]|jgi:hypothetical protein|nr:hypothetical protein [Bifidobacteriaceae bacterium]
MSSPPVNVKVITQSDSDALATGSWLSVYRANCRHVFKEALAQAAAVIQDADFKPGYFTYRVLHDTVFWLADTVSATTVEPFAEPSLEHAVRSRLGGHTLTFDLPNRKIWFVEDSGMVHTRPLSEDGLAAMTAAIYQAI